ELVKAATATASAEQAPLEPARHVVEGISGEFGSTPADVHRFGPGCLTQVLAEVREIGVPTSEGRSAPAEIAVHEAERQVREDRGVEGGRCLRQRRPAPLAGPLLQMPGLR